jgi:hypothetical protein
VSHDRLPILGDQRDGGLVPRMEQCHQPGFASAAPERGAVDVADLGEILDPGATDLDGQLRRWMPAPVR